MMSTSFLLFLLLPYHAFGEKNITPSQPPLFGGKIKHVIAIMLENRSFDHMLGFLHQNDSNINGCLPSLGLNCSNPINSSDPNSKLIYVDNQAVYIEPGLPVHTVSGISQQLYNIYGDNTANYYPPPMKGFIESFKPKDYLNDSGANIMQCFNSKTLPIMYTLAQEFAVIDHWFADVPGPTEPNRIFALMGTSQGMAENYKPKLTEGFDGPNIFKMIDEYAPNNISNTPPQKWRSYFEDAPTSGFLNYVRAHAEHGRFIVDLFEDLKNGELPLFSWVDPGYYDRDPLNRASDEHPDHDVTQGEKLLKNIYENLRKSDRWNDTLLFIYYDEHGGFFDHVPPPNCPNPDGLNSSNINPPFAFKRLGLRVPAILISPWIKKGTVAQKPNYNQAQYCHSSLIHTIRQQFAPMAPALTKRENWSKTFDDLINLNEMRTDCPMTLPDIPEISYENVEWIPGLQQNHEYQISIANSAAYMCGKGDQVDKYMQNQASLGIFVKKCMEEWML
eukprot:552536_1